MHALVLRSIGRPVVVIEARSEQQLKARAAGLSVWPNAQKLLSEYIPGLDIAAITEHNKSIQILAGDGFLVGEIPVLDDVRTTGWNLVHELLLQACTSTTAGRGPAVRVLTSTTVLNIKEEKTQMIVEILGNQGIQRIDASLVIAADGARSYVRSSVLPHIQPEYAGYVAWRGSFPEVLAPKQLQGALEGKLCNFKLDGSYILTYVTAFIGRTDVS